MEAKKGRQGSCETGQDSIRGFAKNNKNQLWEGDLGGG
jgi:hypothetical protein